MSRPSTIERTTTTTTTPPPPARRATSVAYSVLIGLTALAVVLQGLWAGIFLEHDGKRDAASGWIDVHARGGEIALGLSVVALVLAVAKLRSRKDLLIGTGVLVILLGLEGYLGGLIRDQGKDTLTAVHIPLAMVVMALAVWLPFRARAVRRG